MKLQDFEETKKDIEISNLKNQIKNLMYANKELCKKLDLLVVGNPLNDLINEKDIGYIEIPKLKITYDRTCFFDDKVFSNIDELIKYCRNEK